jgi:hypothetical protein
MFVREVEEENVVGLTVNVVPYGVRLVGYERGEDSEVPHAGYNVVPVGFAKV